jgi:mannan endo-1,4-beta-mannosidase
VSWTKEISEYIKLVDSNHLVLDGTYGINPDALDLPSVDMYSDHFYPMDPTKLKNGVTVTRAHKKVYYCGTRFLVHFFWCSPFLV